MSLKNAIGGIALIAGTAIGAAILALPVSTAHLGFFPTLFLYLICWFFMTLGALYLLEANLLVGYGTNLISMAEKTLGRWGKYLCWTTYLILLYALTSAYLTGAGSWITQGFAHLGVTFHSFQASLLTACLTLVIIFLGTAVTDWVNRFLMIGLIAAFLSLVYMTGHHVNVDLLFYQPIHWDLSPLPLIITAFGSAIVVPSLTEYLHGNARQLFNVVFIGSLIPLAIYITWELMIVGIIPLSGEINLKDLQQGNSVVDLPIALEKILAYPWISNAAACFSIFALVTSLLGTSLSLFDFLADGLHIKKNLKGKLLLILIAFLPPLLLSLYYPHGFVMILSLAGIFASLLLGILPALMVWGERFRLKKSSPLTVFGGKPLLITTIVFFTLIVVIEIFNQWQAWMSPA